VEPKGWLNTTAKTEIFAPAGIPIVDAIFEATVHAVLDPEEKGTKTLRSDGNPLPVDGAQHPLKCHFKSVLFWDLT
jgi:hypothetical protein